MLQPEQALYHRFVLSTLTCITSYQHIQDYISLIQIKLIKSLTFLGSCLFGLAYGLLSALEEKYLHQSHWNDLFYN